MAIYTFAVFCSLDGYGSATEEWGGYWGKQGPELRRRLESPEIASAGRQRPRLLRRLGQLQKQHGRGDLSDAAYQAQRDARRLALAALPDDDRIASFEVYRARLLALPEAIAVASPARPFATRQRECPQGDSNP